MNKIEVGVIGNYSNPGDMQAFLARLTQRGHKIKNMQDLLNLYGSPHTEPFLKALANLPHGTIKRFTPITIAIVGASRRFLAQARTNQVGFNYVSASLQYSDYSGEADFVVPYALMKADEEPNNRLPKHFTNAYLDSCRDCLQVYNYLAENVDNDTAGYAAPQGLRNILIMQGNHQSWAYFIQSRTCNRNTEETQSVATRIWEELLKTEDGPELFHNLGADCVNGACREGKFCCGDPMRKYKKIATETGVSLPRAIINDKWPLLKEV